MKRFIVILTSVLLLLAVCLSMLCGCSLVKKDKDYLYNWLLENGELINGSQLVYEDNTFSLYTDHTKKMFVDYTISNYKGYEITVQIPLFSDSKKVKAKITVQNEDSSSTIACYHSPKTFTLKTPLEYDVLSQRPDYDYILMADYGTTVYEDGKYVFHLDESKREEYEKKKSYNAEIDAQRELRVSIAKEVSHKLISDILDWFETEICPSAKMDMSDFGYESYK